MKKIFLFAAAAVTMAAGCQKLQEILVTPNDNPVNDNDAVEIEFTTNVATVETKTRTKSLGSVEALTANHTLYIYGLNTTTPGAKEIINEPATSTATAGAVDQVTGIGAEGTPAAITWKEQGQAFFYNATKDKYEFYGYYVDDAAGATPTPDRNYQLDVTIDGTQDILLAAANPSDDIEGNGVVTAVTDVYSAWSARNGVKPNLKFEHQLSKFTFHVGNYGTSDITLEGVALETNSTAKLRVINVDADNKQGFVAESYGNSTELKLKMGAAVSLPGTSNADYATSYVDGYKTIGTNASIMAFAGQTYKAVLYLKQAGMSEGAVRQVTVPVTVVGGAQPGYSYKLLVKVYSLEQINITATLVAWSEGDDQTLDSEKDQGVTDKEVVDEEEEEVDENTLSAKLTKTTPTTLTYTVSIPAEVVAENGTATRYEKVEAAISTDPANAPTEESAWKNVTFTRASTADVNFTVSDNKAYYCHLRYKKGTKASGANDYTVDESFSAVEATPAANAFAVSEIFFVYDEATYNNLGADYIRKHGNWNKYQEDAEVHAQTPGDFNPIPWLAVICTATPSLELKLEGEGLDSAHSWTWGKTTGLFTIAAGELAVEDFAFVEGKEYTLTVNGVTVKATYKAPVSE